MSEPALLLHAGVLSHQRHVPFRHGFAYGMWMISADLDRLDAAGTRLFGHNRLRPASLHDRDHGPCDGTALAPWIRARLAAAGLGAFGARLRLLAMPRVAGYGFNPIALWFCRDAAGRLGAVLHEVRNTFGGRHFYLLPVTPAAAPGEVVRQTTEKALHVSPFFPLEGTYAFAFRAPLFAAGEKFTLALRYDGAERRLTARLGLTARPAGAANFAALLIRAPLMPVKVMTAIHWQAFRLWRRGARFHPAPEKVTAIP